LIILSNLMKNLKSQSLELKMHMYFQRVAPSFGF
jgi:hypothetical protein